MIQDSSASPPVGDERARALHESAATEAARMPALLARAEHLAGTVLLGEHGRRRPGLGDDFWQYRPALPGDSRRLIDYRRSARGDQQFVREREWQIAQSVFVWADRGASMRFSSDPRNLPEKIDRGRVLALATAILLLRGGERVGLADSIGPPRRGMGQVPRIAADIARDDDEDYALPDCETLLPHARAILISDFLGPWDGIERALSVASDRDVRGVALMVLDPQEESFPWRGRTLFRSVGGTRVHETLKARDLRSRYLERLGRRKERMAALCDETGWRFGAHSTSGSAQSGLLWLFRAIEGTGEAVG